MFFTQSLIAQVQTLPNSIGIGTGINSSIPLHINKNGELARFQGTWPYVTFYDQNTNLGYLQAINNTFIVSSYNNADLGFYVNQTEIMKINGLSGNITANYRLNTNSELNVVGALMMNGNTGTAGQILVSNGTTSPSWEQRKVGFQAGLVSSTTILNNTETILSQFNEKFDFTNSFDNSGGEFTAPSSGLYEFQVNIGISPSGSTAIVNKPAYIRMYKNGVSHEQINHSFDVLQSYGNCISSTFHISLEANDIIYFTFFQLSGITLTLPNSLNGNGRLITCYKVF